MNLPDGVLFLMDRLEGAGHEAYAVGGCVRDALLGLPPKDYDLCTDATPEQLLSVFSDLRVLETGLKHGTVTVLVGEEPFEVTTYRVDGAYADHRHPDQVKFVRSLEQDLGRRDFTVNAMAYHPGRGLQDPFGGREDLQRGLIRCVGEPAQRFEEDALRILRALRFASVYDFVLEEGTAAAAEALCKQIRFVARERVTAEINRLLCGKAAERILKTFPEILRTVVGGHLEGEGISRVPQEVPLRLTHALMREENPSRVLSCLREDRENEKTVTELLRLCREEKPESDLQARRLLRDAGPARTLQLCALLGWESTCVERVLARGDCWSVDGLAVNGRDLLSLGLSGRELGQALRTLLDLVVEEKLPNDREILLACIKSGLNA